MVWQQSSSGLYQQLRQPLLALLCSPDPNRLVNTGFISHLCDLPPFRAYLPSFFINYLLSEAVKLCLKITRYTLHFIQNCHIQLSTRIVVEGSPLCVPPQTRLTTIEPTMYFQTRAESYLPLVDYNLLSSKKARQVSQVHHREK